MGQRKLELSMKMRTPTGVSTATTLFGWMERFAGRSKLQLALVERHLTGNSRSVKVKTQRTVQLAKRSFLCKRGRIGGDVYREFAIMVARPPQSTAGKHHMVVTPMVATKVIGMTKKTTHASHGIMPVAKAELQAATVTKNQRRTAKKCHNPDKFTLVIKKGKGTCVSSGCQNGKAIEATEDVKGSKQTDCDPNGCFDDFLYDETTKQCLASYKTTCNNGKPKDNNYHMQPTELCSECHKGFGLNAETNTCAAVVCANGKAPFPYSFKGKANLKTCASCDDSYYLCPNGICYYDTLLWHDTC